MAQHAKLVTPIKGAGGPTDVGLSDTDRRAVAEGLSQLFADTYALYIKTHGFHWNVTGPNFRSLHLLFEGQYQELADAVDVIAERIRALGYPAPASYAEFAPWISIPDARGVPDAHEMVRILAADQEACARVARSVFPTAERANDQASVDILTDRMRAHEKAAWMLRSQQG